MASNCGGPSVLIAYGEATRRPGEGLYDWMMRHARAAWRVPPDAAGYRCHLGLLWAFDDSGAWPVLKTVARDR